MLTEEKLKILCELTISNDSLSTKLLNENGFSSLDLKSLVEGNILKRIKMGYYQMISVDILYHYALSVLPQSGKGFWKSMILMEKCFAINPNHWEIRCQLFLRSIKEKDYEKAFYFMKKVEESKNACDYHYYLYLLEQLATLPKEYHEYLSTLTMEDYMIPNPKKKKQIQEKNLIRNQVFLRKYANAKKSLNHMMRFYKSYSVNEVIEKTLLTQIIEKNEKRRKHLLSLVQEEDYDTLRKYFEEKKTKDSLSVNDQNIRILLQKINSLLITSYIPPKKEISLNADMFTLLVSNHFDLALEESKEFNQKKHIPNDQNLLFLLLEKINYYISQIEKGYKIEVIEVEEDDSTDRKIKRLRNS